MNCEISASVLLKLLLAAKNCQQDNISNFFLFFFFIIQSYPMSTHQPALLQDMTATSWERLRLTRAPSETCSNCCLCYVTGQVTHLEESAIYPPPHTQAHRCPWLTCIALIDRGRQSMPFTPREYSNSSLPDYRTFLLCHSGSVCLTELNEQFSCHGQHNMK